MLPSAVAARQIVIGAVLSLADSPAPQQGQGAIASERSSRRLSPLRVVIAIVVVLALAAAGYYGFRIAGAQAAPKPQKWFAGYVDVTATPTYAFESAKEVRARNVVLSFVVADPDDACQPSWGAAYSLDAAAASLDLDRRIARLEQRDGNVIVSFGGLANQELASACTDSAELLAAYRSVVTRYDLTTIDLDIEAGSLTDAASASRRADAIAALQKERRKAGSPLAVWLTLPVTPAGLSEDGTNAVAAMLAAGVDVSGVNVMTMDYGASRTQGDSMAKASEKALTATHRQLGILYKQAGISLGDASVWSKLGATPMVGQNDEVGEVFSLADAKALNAFARENGVSRLSMWSLNRDATCGPNYVDLQVVSDACSGIDQKGQTFVNALSKGYDGNPRASAGVVTTSEPTSASTATDDPRTSPYPIWKATSAYLEGTKVVWHRNVYVAKWWSRGDVPDNPVLQEWSTPWTLLGPVLPGETPIPVPTLAPGTYPDWAGTAIYDKGDRVLFDGVPFESKWWNQGASPDAASADPDSSPWVALTQAQIDQVEAGD
ncbi:glycosyl hydrolase family 18 protein [Microbacterium sp. STN6]|uniref:chitinase n=1 Tax=Microbacterium sp. STN6 TaxID=2995588 RepID=UPI002260F617|nr:glycosyl hydrolase family 18 protein [Microbacterium sp. STN6]MCX7521482.1 glycosyl hydrolase family 18 protein [Microbacterium sp. STN6]